MCREANATQTNADAAKGIHWVLGALEQTCGSTSTDGAGLCILKIHDGVLLATNHTLPVSSQALEASAIFVHDHGGPGTFL